MYQQIKKKKRNKLRLKLSIAILVLSLYSCKTAQQHIEAAKRHSIKAVKKGALILHKADTLLVEKIVSDTLTVRDTTFVTSHIVNTVIEKGEVRYVTRRDKKREAKMRDRIYRDSITITKLTIRKNAKLGIATNKQENKTERVKTRQENKGSRWWIWVLVGYFLNIVVRIALKRITNIV